MGGFNFNKGLWGSSGSGNITPNGEKKGSLPGMSKKTKLFIIVVVVIASYFSLNPALNKVVNAYGYCEKGLLTCYVSGDEVQNIYAGQAAEVGSYLYLVDTVGTEPMTRAQVSEKFPDEHTQSMFDLEDANYEVSIDTGLDLEDGFYAVSIKPDSLAP